MPRPPVEAAAAASTPAAPAGTGTGTPLLGRTAALVGLLDREPRSTPSVVLRARQAAACLLLVVVAFVQRPGAVSGDTKLDLTQDPGGWLAAGLRVWTPDALGSLQNQAYGYLFPMGPFHLAGLAADLPAWVVQRAWWATLLVAAFLGTVRLAARLDLGRPGVRVLAGLAYALSPRMLTELGGLSSELMPLAALPWVLVPLAGPAALRLPRRAAARSGIAVLCAGAVNAAATVVVLPLAALLLAPGLRTAAGRRLAAWWVLATTLACLWWVVPLLVQGAYSPPFLDYIESAATTTMVTSPVEVLRGTSHWLAYLSVEGVPWWPAGWTLLTSPAVVVDTAVLAALGLAGLACRSMPHRGPLVLGALLGLAVMTLGHGGPVGSPFAEQVRDLLDGPLAPFRNVHKADPLVRLPLVLGLCHVLASVAAPRPRRLLAGVAVVALVGAATPALATQLTPPGAFASVPAYWSQAAAYVDARGGRGTSLLVPAASDAEHLWGRPLDDPLQVLAASPVAVRDAVPLGGPEVTRLLDAVEARLGSGRGSPGLGEVLARAGVGFLVVRNDLDTSRAGAARPALVRQALRRSGGVSLARVFGPWFGTSSGHDGLVSDSGLDLRRPAVEVWEVDGFAGPVTTYPREGAWSVDGGPDALLQLADAGLLGGAAVLVGPDGEGLAGRTAVTDGLRRQAVDVGRVRDNRSPTLPADAPVDVEDLLPALDDDRLVTAELTGIADLRASSSAADVTALLHRSQDRGPFAALDGDAGTYWASSDVTGAAGQWLEVQLERPRDLAGLTIALAGPQASPQLAQVEQIRVDTDTGAVSTGLFGVETTQPLQVPPGPTSRLRITVTRSTPGTGNLAAVRELSLPGVDAGRTLVLPPAPPSFGEPGDAVLLDVAAGARDACVEAGRRVRCSPELPRRTEETGGLDRTVALPGPTQVEVTARGRPRPGPELDALLDRGAPVRVTASSRAVQDPRARPGAVVDGDDRTGWVAAEPTPTLALAWDVPRPVSGVRLEADPNGLVAARVTRVRIRTDGGSYTRAVPVDGRVAIPALPTDQLTVTVLETEPLVDVRSGGRLSSVPVGFSEVGLLGLSDDAAGAPAPQDRIAVPCADGPVVQVGDRQLRFSATGTREDVLALRPLELRPCGSTRVHLAAGERRVQAPPAAAVDVTGVTLRVPPAGPAAARSRAVEVLSWGAEDRALRIAPGGDQWLGVGEAFNRGWRATLDGVRLDPVRLDGWRQGWAVPAGAGGQVRLEFLPGRVQAAGLLAGAAAVAVLLALALLSRRRPGPAPAAPRASSRRAVRAAVVAGTAVLLGALAGWVGLGLWAAGTFVALRLPRALPFVAAAAMSAAGVLVALAPWGRFEESGGQAAPAQVLALTAVAAVALSLLLRRPAAPAACVAAPAPRQRGG